MAFGDRDVRLNVVIDEDGRGAAKAADDLDRIDKSAGKADASLDKLGKTARRVDTEIDHHRANIRALAEEYEKTGDVDLFKNLRKDQSAIRNLEKVRKELDSIGEEGGRTFTGIVQGVTGAFDGMPEIVKTALVAGAIAGAPIIISVLGAAAGAAVGVGFGGGIIAAGITKAANDSRVQDAWSHLTQSAEDAFTSAAGPFAEPLESAIERVDRAIQGISPELDSAFARLAPLVDELGVGAEGLIRNLGPALDTLANFSAPFIQDLADWLPELGEHIDEFADRLSNAGPGMREFFNDLLDLTNGAIDVLGDLIQWGSKVYEGFSALGTLLEGDYKGAVQKTIDMGHEAAKSYGGFHNETINVNTAMGLLNGTLEKTAGGQIKVRDQNTDLGGAFDALVGKIMGVDEALIGQAAATDRVAQSYKENGRQLDIHTEKGRANRESILGVVQANVAQFDAEIRSGAGADEAAKHYDENTRALERQLLNLGYTQQEVDDLVGKYKGVPGKVPTVIALDGVAKAINDLADLLARINHVATTHYGSIIITEQYRTSSPYAPGGSVYSSQVPRYQEKGGIVAAATGLITSSPTVVFGERRTVREAFIPMRGISDSRGLQLADQAASWHGGMVVPKGSAMAGGAATLQIEWVGGAASDEFITWLRRNIRIRGGLSAALDS
jgi:hypothetical protein